MSRTSKNIGMGSNEAIVDPRNSAFALDNSVVPAAGFELMESGVVMSCVARSSRMLVRQVFAFVTIAALAASSVSASAKSTDTHLSKTNYMQVHGQALPPFGFIHFCQRHRRECTQLGHANYQRFNATRADFARLDQINRAVNKRIKPITDLELYGQEEYWTFPTQQGDCEDYVVLKRRILIENGWPASALLITVVRDEVGEGHAVLTARTKQGDFVLDNKVNEVTLWNKTPYKYLMRQSYLNPKLWMALDPQARRGAGSVAGVD